MACVPPNSSASAFSSAALAAPPLEISVPSMSKRTTCMKTSLRLRFDARAEHFEEAGQPLRVCRPRRGGHEVAIHICIVLTHVYPPTTRALDLRTDRRVGRAAAPRDDTRRRED